MNVFATETKTPTWTPEAGFPSRVWRTQVAGSIGDRSFSLPATGLFDVILIEVPRSDSLFKNKTEVAEGVNVPRISDFIGYGRRFHPEYRSTEDVMRELREGEEE